VIDRIKQIMGDDPDVHAIRKQSSKLRKHLERDVDGLRNQAQELMDWKHYVRKYPVATIGAAVVLGYLLVPRRSPIVNIADLVPAMPVEPMSNDSVAPTRPEPVPEPAPPSPPPHHHSMIAAVGEAILSSTLAFAGQRLLMHLMDRASQGVSPKPESASPTASERRVPEEGVEHVHYSDL